MGEPALTVNIPQTEGKSYPIYIDNEDITTLKTRLDEETKDTKRLVIFSEKVYKIYGKTLGFDKSEIFNFNPSNKVLKLFTKTSKFILLDSIPSFKVLYISSLFNSIFLWREIEYKPSTILLK